ncbi:Uncharacterised protein [Legionella busanensis]|uniref:Uncharacterized protein n=1 Tax=Legionella busanensis TaxID=190655 RepID=A0A378JPP0_9GAMM|nr:hypothetical protein [Legionella busanensis]STX50092.1 Uncharacterised protein [Legionella busanensis]
MATFFASTNQKLPERQLFEGISHVDSALVDSAFRAVAATLIDNILTDRRITANKPLLDKILERHRKYFNLTEGAGLLTPNERLFQLINRPEKMAKFVAEFAYTLRQIAVDQLIKDPERYMLVFLEENEGRSLKEIRDPNTSNGNTLIAALADALAIPVLIEHTLPKKDLPESIEYGPNAMSSFNAPQGIKIHLQGEVYIPYLRNAANFKSIYSSTQEIHPKEALENDPSIDTIIDKVNTKKQNLLKDFKGHQRRLEYAIQDMGDIHNRKAIKDKLIAIYISPKNKKQLAENTKYVGTEHGNERFFEVIQGKQSQRPIIASFNTTNNPKADNYNNYVIQELIIALAREMTIGQLDENLVYEALEAPSSAPRQSLGSS